MKLLQKNGYSNTTCIDVGGNHGFYTVFSAKFDCVHRVDYYEPQSNLRRRACAAIRDNRLTDVVNVHDTGIGQTRGRFQTVGSEGGAYLVRCVQKQTRRCISTDALDALYAPFLEYSCTSQESCRPRLISFLKIDNEGWEISALLGAQRLIAASQNGKKLVGALLIEVAPNRWQTRSNVDIETGSDVIARLQSHHKYTIWFGTRASQTCPHKLLSAIRECNDDCDRFLGDIWTPLTAKEVRILITTMVNHELNTKQECTCNIWLQHGSWVTFKHPRTLQMAKDTFSWM
jgi:FkbM family methyltransferase